MGNAKLPPGIDAEAVRAGFVMFRRNREHIDRHIDELLRDHEGEWVVFHDGEFLFGAELEDAIGAGERAGWPLGNTAIEHLLRERPVVLLRKRLTTGEGRV